MLLQYDSVCNRLRIDHLYNFRNIVKFAADYMGRFENIDRLFRLYYRPLCLYATHYLKDPDAVEDIVQDAFKALWEKMTVSEVQSPKSYLYASVRNSCVSRVRSTNRFLDDVSPEDLSEVISDEEAVDRAFSESALWKAINDLPKKRRQMLLMEKRDGMSCAEIASELGVSEGTVKNQISRALKSLRKKGKEIILYFFF